MIAVDTHVLIWWATGDTDRLSKRAKEALEQEMSGGKIYVSSISAWEIALLVARERIELTNDPLIWLATVAEIEPIEFVPIDNEIAVRSTRLGEEVHRDLADRFIVATCQKLSVPLVTADDKIRRYRAIKTIW